MGWGSDPIVQETPSDAPWERDPIVPEPRPAPSYLQISGNALAKGAAGIPDAILNTPANLYNLAKTGIGMGAYGIGRPDIGNAIEMTQPPSLVRSQLQQRGIINPANEPQTAGQRILDTAIQGGIGTAIAPSSSVGQIAKNALLGMTGGGAAQIAKEVTGSEVAAIGIGLLTPLAARSLASKSTGTPIRTQTLKEATEVGYVVPPSTIKSSFMNNRVESLAGKSAVGQAAAAKNQTVTNRLAAKALGLPEDTPLSEGILESVRDKAAAPYREVEALRSNITMPWFPNFHTPDLLGKLRQVRYDATQFFKHHDMSGDPASLEKAKNAMATASGLEKDIENIAKAAKKPELIQQLKEARTLMAKSYDVERALNVADGNISAPVLARMLDRGKPLSGELRLIGKFALAFPSVAREGARVPSAGVSGTDAAASAILGTMGYGAAGGPTGLVAAGLPLLRGPARAMALSPMYQRILANPSQPSPWSDALMKSALLGRAVAEREMPQ